MAILDREAQVERLSGEIFDLAVIGGGINGAAVARDAAMRGLRVALVERADFAGATSSRSSKLIHGGLRYLPQGQFRLVRAALGERERLRHFTAPHLVKPLRFLFPVYRGRRPWRIELGAGLWLYDLFARTPRPERHRRLNRAAILSAEPLLNAAGLNGGAVYYDAEADDARLTMENVIDAAVYGAAVANYVEVEGVAHRDGRVAAIHVRDRISGAQREVRARVFVNAAGPWIDDVRQLDDPGVRRSVRLTKGVHLVFDRERLPVNEALVLSDGQGRIVFVIPQDKITLVGTTDTDFAGDPERVAADSGDVQYLLGIIAQNLPDTAPGQADILASFAGLRALAACDSDGHAPSSVSREEILLESASGLVSAAGGKLTTHREIAERVVNRVLAKLGLPAKRSPTRDIPLPGARPVSAGNSTAAAKRLADMPEALREAIASRYGTRSILVADIAGELPDPAAPIAPGCPVAAAEVLYAVRYEMALRASDFIQRRTAISWRYPRSASAAAAAAARLMAKDLGWDAAREKSEGESCDPASW
jgi:glycerol-3-phosphate dehydrogenase